MTGSMTSAGPLRLYGRSAERERVAALSDRLGPRQGGALLLAAEPGLGRTALLDRAAGDFTAGPVLRPRVAPAESGLPYSGVHALLCAAAGRTDTAPASVLRAGLAPAGLLELLPVIACGGPLLVCIDDAHLWDAPSRTALGFAARRTGSLPGIGLLLSVDGARAGDPDFSGLPVVRLGPLDDRAATALLDGLTGGEAAPAVRDQLLHAAEGNPALLAALVEGLSPDRLRGHRPLPRPLVDGGALSRAFGARLAPLPADTRLLLLLACAAHEADPEGAGADADHVLRAARAAGLDAAVLDPAEAAGVARCDGERVAFGSALLRRAVYAAAPPPRRRAAHALLASVVDGGRHPLRRLFHLALAAEGPDSGLAAALTDAATASGSRMSDVRRSAALALAAGLTARTGARVSRLTAAAEYALLGGRPHQVRELLSTTRDAAVHDAVRGRAELVRGTLALRDGAVGDAYETLMMAAVRLGPYDPQRALAAGLAAMEAAWAAGDAGACLAALDGTAAHAPGAGRVTAAPGAAAAQAQDYRSGLRTALGGRPGEAREALRRVLDRARSDDDPTRLLRAGVAALVLGDTGAACHANARALAVSRARGLASLAPQVLEHLAYAELRAGQHARAGAHAQEGLRAAHRAGQRNVVAHQHAILAMVASVEGGAAAVAAHARQALQIAGPHGLAQAATLAEWASARADLCHGRVREAAARLGPLTGAGPHRGHFAIRMLAVPCFVEAAVSSGLRAQARAAVEEYTGWVAQGTDAQASAQLARCRALLAAPEDTDALYAVALARHEATDGAFERARTQLLYGKWLRRQRRPGEAKNRLRDALVGFERCGALPWAEQTRAELRATGEAPAPARTGSLAALTPQQLRIARRVAEGATNREVALSLSVSPRTVDHHLRNVFALLGVRSRTELSRLVDRAEQHGAE
ncbi:LuxR C-terminal-related transcriptional regulator [Streptomyces sp. NPDC058655]|uniref:LuxR C-terminal-related transcriptional regulator n=1 Tax=Streptomyces sp. NPDC058655 TaxID=3346577 RepID=UPI0036479533